jgi:uncharacterized protein (TIGR00255 family)
MTGFGKATLEWNSSTITVEIRSLNSKQLDLNFRTSSRYKSKELELRTTCTKQIERGKADVSIYLETNSGEKNLAINKALAKNYFSELKALATELSEPTNELLALVLKMPEVLKSDPEEAGEAELENLKTCVDKAIAEFIKFRLDEGKVLQNEFETRLHNIVNLLQSVELLDVKRAAALRSRIEKNIAEFVDKEKIDQNRFEQELIYYIEKIDITEEKLRLKTHCDYFLKTMNEEESVGRKLGFISQEIGREINTIGSKANDSAIQMVVVQMKDELEKIKEQLLNVL